MPQVLPEESSALVDCDRVSTNRDIRIAGGNGSFKGLSLRGIDLIESGDEVDARIPSVEWRQVGKMSQLCAIALGGHSGEVPAIRFRHSRNSTGDDQTCGEAFDVPLKGPVMSRRNR
jgi:hypothetical protein